MDPRIRIRIRPKMSWIRNTGLRYRTEQYSVTECANYVKPQFGPEVATHYLERQKAIEEEQTEGRKGHQNSKTEPRRKPWWSQNENHDKAKLTAKMKPSWKPRWSQYESQYEDKITAKMKAKMTAKMKKAQKEKESRLVLEKWYRTHMCAVHGR
jgi:hypothetical protein